MGSDATAKASALDAGIEVVENSPDPARVLRRLHNDVVQCRRVLGEIEDAPDRAREKHAQLVADQEAEIAEAEAMVAAARDALAAAEAALAEVEG